MRLTYSPSTSHHHHYKLSSSFLSFFQLTTPSSSCVDINNNIHKKPTRITAAATQKPKIAVIMGPTGAGKSRLSTDIVTRVLDNSEIINCDKMQVYKGLDITTNKITMQERLGVPHHLLGDIDPTGPAFTPLDFREVVPEIISDIGSRGGLPVVVGGSNSLIYSLVTERYDPRCDVFNGPHPYPVSPELRYDCCFIWVDVCEPVLNKYLSKRVDEMLDSGMFEELVEFFRAGEHKRVNPDGIGQAIGIPEFEKYFNEFPGFSRLDGTVSEVQLEAFNEAIKRIKDNTCHLAKKQVTKILRLRDTGWDLKKVNASEAFRARVMAGSSGEMVAEIWEKQVVQPSINIMKQFMF